MELEMKLVPLTVRVKLLLPTTFEVGERLVMVGTGLIGGGGGGGGETEATCMTGMTVYTSKSLLPLTRWN